jgi:hypothetical protein
MKDTPSSEVEMAFARFLSISKRQPPFAMPQSVIKANGLSEEPCKNLQNVQGSRDPIPQSKQ